MILSFSSPAAVDTALCGGKGAGLAKAAQAGLPVPDGVILTTAAYRGWFAAHREQVSALLARHHDYNGQSAAVRDYLAAQALPDTLAAALDDLQARYPEAYFAVRSSGSAEDLPGAAFAGLHDTFLNVRGSEALARAVKDCWLSLWNAEVMPYRERLQLAHEEAAMAVVIQLMVDVGMHDAAGVAFSIDPVRGRFDQVLINAAFGLGETVVAGAEPVDEYRVGRNGALCGQTIADKPAALVRAKNGNERRPLPHEQQNAPAVNAAQAAAIAALARRAEQHFGFPQDIEWAYAGNELYLLQSRPVTRFAPRWTRDESAERFPNPVTPLTWTLCEEGFHRSLNYSFDLMGLPPFNDKWFVRKDSYIYGNQNAVELYTARLPLAPLASAQALEQFIRDGGLWQFHWITELPTRWAAELDGYLLALGRFDAIDYRRRGIRDCWQDVKDINELGSRYFLPNIAISLTQTLLYRVLRHTLHMLDPDRAQSLFDRLIAGTDTKTAAVNKNLWQLSRLLRRHPELMRRSPDSRETLEALLSRAPEFAREFNAMLALHGHRETDFDAYRPTWLEAPQHVFAQIRIMATQDDDNDRERHYWQKKSLAARTEREVVQAAPEHLRFFLQELINHTRIYTALDDMEHYQTTRLTLPFRRAAHALGQHLCVRGILDAPADIFFLTPDSIDQAVTRNDYHALRAEMQENKAQYRRACTQSPAWEYGKDNVSAAAQGNTLQGLGGSPGVVEGEVFVILDPAQFADFPQGAVLVARTTNPAWTPLFYHACGIITESGGPLSHGAVTARELGIPAVMGIRDACRLLKNGQRVRLDGQSGQLTVLPPDSGRENS